MGGNNSKKQKQTVQHSELSIDHQRFKHFKIINDNQLIQITVQIQSEEQLKNWQNKLKKIKSFEQKQSLLVPVKHQYQPKGFCGSVGLLKIYFQFYPYLFQEEIFNRINLNQHFQQQQLWYLAYSLVSSARDFSKQGEKIGDVRPHNIFINEEGQIKIANRYSWPNQHTNFQKTVFQKQKTYLSPQQDQLIKKGIQQNKTDYILSQSFSIGLTLLESALLFDAKTLYQPQLNIQQLTKKLQQWKDLTYIDKSSNQQKKYSPLLTSVIYYLCQPTLTERYTSINIEKILRPYQNQIINLKPFDKSSFPISNQSVQPTKSMPPSTNVQVNNQFVQTYKPVQTQNIQPTQAIQNIPNVYYPNQNELPKNIPPQNTIRPHLIGPNNPAFNQPSYVYNDAYSQQFKKYAESITYNPPPPQPQPIISNINYQPFNKTVTIPQVQPQNQQIKYQFVPYNPNNYNQPQQFNTTNIYANQNIQKNQTYLPQFNLPTNNSTSNNFIPTQSVYTTPQLQKPSSNLDFLKKLDQQLENSRKQFPS